MILALALALSRPPPPPPLRRRPRRRPHRTTPPHSPRSPITPMRRGQPLLLLRRGGRRGAPRPLRHRGHPLRRRRQPSRLASISIPPKTTPPPRRARTHPPRSNKRQPRENPSPATRGIVGGRRQRIAPCRLVRERVPEECDGAPLILSPFASTVTRCAFSRPRLERQDAGTRIVWAAWTPSFDDAVWA